jgi:hypothetical protein
MEIILAFSFSEIEFDGSKQTRKAGSRPAVSGKAGV